jgi:hypothetical protein
LSARVLAYTISAKFIIANNCIPADQITVLKGQLADDEQLSSIAGTSGGKWPTR